MANVSIDTPSGTSAAMTKPSLLMTADAIAPQLCLSALSAGFNSIIFSPDWFQLEHTVFVALAHALDLFAVQTSVGLGLVHLSDDSPQPVACRAICLSRLNRAFGNCGRFLENDIVDPTSGTQQIRAHLEIFLRLLSGYLRHLIAEQHTLSEEQAVAGL